jgi:hypothetical protein
MRFQVGIKHLEGCIHALGDFQARAEQLIAREPMTCLGDLVGLAAELRQKWRECLGQKRAGHKIIIEEED